MNAPDKNLNQHPNFNKSDASIDPKHCTLLKIQKNIR